MFIFNIPIVKNNAYFWLFAFLLFTLIFLCSCIFFIHNGKLGAIPFFNGPLFLVYYNFDYLGWMCGLFSFGCKIMTVLF
jgi:hypothetical protein